MKITEEERKEILSKYEGNTSDKLLTYLKRHYRVSEINFDWMKTPVKQIYIGDKLYFLANNKKFLVEKLFNELQDEWSHLDTPTLRRTIKKYLDG